MTFAASACGTTAQAMSIIVDAPDCSAGGVRAWTAATNTLSCQGGSQALVGTITTVVPGCPSGTTLAWDSVARTIACQATGGQTTTPATVQVKFSLPNCLAGAMTWSASTRTLTCPSVVPPASLATFGGSGQAAPLGTPFDNSLTAIVRAAAGNPLPGVMVTFHAPLSGAAATLFDATVVTDEDGLASASASANAVLGPYAVTATVAGVQAATTFNLTNTVVVPPPPRTLNLDKSTATHYDPLSDGLLALRYMFGLRGEGLTDGAVTATALRNDPVAIATLLGNMSNELDIDDNGVVDALTDGMLIMRYMFGLRGASLISGAVGPNAVAATTEAIEARLQALMP
ncbi:MAG: Ig-like domain-containing protein [Casimicrobiaceae bacterium]